MRNILIILSALILIVSPHPIAFASPKEDLEKIQKEASEANEKSEQLDYEAKETAKKRAELSLLMVKSAAALQQSEARLSAIEEKLRILGEQIAQKTADLLAKKKEVALMVQAALKLSRTPPESIIIMPGNMMDNMKASRALKITTESIRKESDIILIQMQELEALKEKVVLNQAEEVKETERLAKQKLQLQAQIDEHNALQRKLTAAQREARAKLQNLAKKASDLQSLIASIEKEEKKERERNKKAMDADELIADDEAPAGKRGSLRSFSAYKGKIRIPAAGKLIQRYGETSKNETSRGISIQTRDEAQVTSPFDAEVLFTGPFMEYGKVIILKHSGGFHTLLAGINKIDVSVGDFLLEGEPIGAMGDGDSNKKLYLELRSNGRHIDPAGWIRGLNK